MINHDDLKQMRGYEGQIKDVRTVPERDGKTVPASTVLPDRIALQLGHDLYEHQAKGLELLDRGEDIVVSTGTSSGKTLIYALHIAREYLKDPDTQALLVYPTKALTRDQEKELTNLYGQLDLDLEVGVHDGDTSGDEKKRVRKECNVIMTNFPGLNYYLSNHHSWGKFFSDLKLISIDESHQHRGIQGMHAAWITRRLRRIVERQYEATPQLVMTSATIGNPSEHSEELTGREVEVISEDTSPRGKREVVFWDQTAMEKAGEIGGAHKQASLILSYLADQRVQTLQFVRSRKLTELSKKWAESFLRDVHDNRKASIGSYNAGHSKNERRALEEAMKNESVEGVCSTTALEMGINIGSMEATTLDGYPGSRISFWQQVGRSGRVDKEALSVLVAKRTPLDQFILKNPDHLLDSDFEDAVIDLDNENVYASHVLAAANEMPLTEDDQQYFGQRLEQAVDMFAQTGLISGDLDTGAMYAGQGNPAENIDFYATGDDRFEVIIMENGQSDSKEPVDRNRAYRDLHPNAIHLHKGKFYKVIGFDKDSTDPSVTLEPVEVDYYTKSLREVKVRDLQDEKNKDIGSFQLCFGEGTVKQLYSQYQKKRIEDDEVIDTRATGLEEPVDLDTYLCWLEIPEAVQQEIEKKYSEPNPVLGGIHAIEHALLNIAPVELMLDSSDLGGVSESSHPETESATIFIYDDVEGGLGLSAKVYEKFNEMMRLSKTLIQDCDCVEGCPSCILSSHCDEDKPLHPEIAVDILESALDGC